MTERRKSMKSSFEHWSVRWRPLTTRLAMMRIVGVEIRVEGLMFRVFDMGVGSSA